MLYKRCFTPSSLLRSLIFTTLSQKSDRASGILFLTLILWTTSISLLGCDSDPQRPGQGSGGASPGGVTSGEEYSDVDAWWQEDSFADHTVSDIESVRRFTDLSFDQRGMQTVKFWVTEPEVSPLSDSGGWGERAMVRFYEGDFYKLHDELYWYRLLRGHPVWGYSTLPHSPAFSGETIEEIYRQTRTFEDQNDALPLDLKWSAEGRLYSPQFYHQALDSPRRMILGSVLFIEAREGRRVPEELWVFELEYQDQPSAQEVTSLREVLRAHLPPEASDLRWLTRSPAQETLAADLAAQGAEVGLGALTYHDLTAPNEAEVYSEGITAGRARLMDETRAASEERDVLIYTRIPDDLPPCRGVITSIPQTPLAHLNLLARNRGVPNLYLSEVDSQPALAQLASSRAPVLFWTEAPDQWMLLPLTLNEYRDYLELRVDPTREITLPSADEVPRVISLTDLTPRETFEARPMIGGKSAGLSMIHYALGGGGEAVTPPSPLLAITGSAYAEHVEPLQGLIVELIADPEFQDNPLVRSLALEGWLGVRDRYQVEFNERPIRLEQLFEWESSLSDPLRAIIGGGGVRGWIRAQPISAEISQSLTGPLQEVFASLHPEQGLRFRSSSNVEDLEGFNGAGLYSSSTGFLYPHVQPQENDRIKDVSRALRDTWASYWGVEAFEEREAEGIDHSKGWMGVAVHPRFDDRLERNNGVMTLTLLPPPPLSRGQLSHRDTQPLFSTRGALHSGAALLATATLNSQLGSLSVTNPDSPNTLTEVLELKLSLSEAFAETLQQASLKEPLEALNPLELAERTLDLTPLGLAHLHDDEISVEITRAQRSTLAEEVLTDTEARDLAKAALRVALVWWRSEIESHALPRRPESLTLDFEFRGVHSGWPRLRRGAPSPARFILKQARPLEPAPRGLSSEVWGESIPLDITRRAEEVIRWRCESASLTLETLQVKTSPLATLDLGFSIKPFTAQIRFTDHRAEAWRADTAYELHHRQFITLATSDQDESLAQGWSFNAYRRADAPLPFELLTISQAGSLIRWVPRSREGELSAEVVEPVECAPITLYASPQQYLSTLASRARTLGVGYGSHVEQVDGDK